MGQEQSRDEGAPSRKMHPKFQNMKARSNNTVSSSSSTANIHMSIPSPTTQTDDTGSSGSALSESSTNLQPPEAVDHLVSANIGDQPSFSSAPLNKPTTTYSYTVNNNGTLISTTEMEHTNPTVYPASSQSSTPTDNIRPEQNQNFAKLNNTAGESSTSSQSEKIKKNLPHPKGVPVVPVPTIALKVTPKVVRDVRHVPTSNEQIRLNSTSDGNPFLSSNDHKSENESIKIPNYVPVELKKKQITERLEVCYRLGVLDRADLDKRAIESLNDLPLEDAFDVLNKFVASNPKTKLNKSAFLCSMIKNRINGQIVGNNKILDQTQKSRESCSQSVPSSQNKSVKCFNDNHPIPTECNNIGYEGDQEVNEQIKLISIPLVQEVTGDNLFSAQNIRTREGSEVEVESIDTSENDHLSRDHVINFENNLITTFGQQVPLASNSKRASKVKTQFKRNVVKNHSVKLGTLKDMDRIAESLCSSNKVDTNAFTKEISPIISMTDNVDMLTSLSFEECIIQMKNVKFLSGEKLSLLQQSVCINLRSIDSFIKGLKGLFPLNDQIISEFNILKDNIMSFPTDVNRLSLHGNVTSITNNKTFINPEKSHSPSTDSFEKTNFMNPLIKHAFPNTNAFEEFQQNKSTSNSNLDLIVELFNELPTEYQSESHNITFQDGYLYCKVCKKSIVLCQSNLIDHINDENHRKMLKTSEQSKNLEQPQIERGQFKDSIPVSPTSKNIDNFELGKNHHGILNIIYKSFENNLPLPKTVFICLFCDFFDPDRKGLERHIELHPTEKGEWYSCDTCAMVIYGTSAYFQTHCLSEQHLNIMKIKCKKLSNEEVEEEKDNISVCSSNSGRKNPHEILLLIAKDSKNKNKMNGPVGLYCQICNRYFRYSPLDITNRLENHIIGHSGYSRYKSLKSDYCTTCNVELFGENPLWSEHNNMELHKEMAGRSNNAQPENNTSAGIRSQISNEKGPHYELMKEVLKKHLNNESSKNAFGFYCYYCEMYTFDEKEWKIHLNNASHLNRTKSYDCINKNVLYNCLICKIFLICDDSIFIQHEQSLAHEALSRLQNSRNSKGAQLVNEDEELLQSESDESDNEDDKFSESQSTCSSIQNPLNDKRTPIGINITKLTPEIFQKDVFHTFKSYGHIKECTIRKSRKSGSIIFSNKDVVQRVLEQKNFYIKGIKIGVYPLFEAQTGEINKPCRAMMNATVIEVLKHQKQLQILVCELESEVNEVHYQFEQRKAMIEQDILRIIPGCKVHIFGSQFTGLAIRDSDFDIYIDHDGRSYFRDMPQRQQEGILYGFLEKFTNPQSRFRVCETVLEARVPILRIVHKRTEIPCDISCRSGLSMENSMLTRLLFSSDRRVRWLVLAVKWWMRSNDLLASNKFTSYATTWIVLFYLMYMQRNILVSISAMKEGCPPYSIGNWDCRFNRNVYKRPRTQNNSSEFKLLADFFNFYATFKFKSVVLCPLTATCISRNDFEQCKLPPVFQPYINKIAVQNSERLRITTPICVQDPFDLSHNITKGVSRQDLNKFRRFCKLSAQLCKSQGFKQN